MSAIEKYFNIAEKKIIITGGYGYLGSGISKKLCEFGAKIIVVGKNKTKAESLLNECYGNAIFYECDLQGKEDIKNIFRKIFDENGTIDVLINNANYSKLGRIENITDQDWEYSIDGSINNYFRCTREIFQYIKKPGGKIINIASMYGIVSPNPEIYGETGFDNPAAYGAGKAAIIQFTKYAAVYFSKYGINVNSISPGPFPSKNVQKDKNFIDALSQKVPLKRIGKPEELVGAVLLLASEASSYITGHNLVVDGGWTIW